MKRYSEDQNIIKREHDRRLAMYYRCRQGSNPMPPNKFDLQKGRYRKKDAFDCGNPGCVMCHYEKVLKIKSHNQKKSDISFREQLKDS